MPIKYVSQCSEHKASFVPNICSEVELFRTYKLPKTWSVQKITKRNQSYRDPRNKTERTRTRADFGPLNLPLSSSLIVNFSIGPYMF